LESKYLAYADTLPEFLDESVREKKLKDKRRELIEGIRFEVTAKEAEVVQAMFPFLPFKDEEFDRFVAFWSISTYVFEHLKDEELTRYWQEILRLLKPGGKAYISPLFDHDELLLGKTLNQFSSRHPDFVFSFDDPYFPKMLVIEKK
jgi:ubiquinone/menaquinone biosynthesis C-methylase UbiE